MEGPGFKGCAADFKGFIARPAPAKLRFFKNLRLDMLLCFLKLTHYS